MANDPISSKTLTLPIIHAHWIAALDRPPTTSLAPLRRLINSIIKHGVNHGAQHGESTLLPRQHFALLWLDLCLTYAYLGDYWLAIKAADSSVALYPTFAIGWFAKGLCKAELGEWRKARRDFKQCLICFEVIGERMEKIPYKIDQSRIINRTGLGEEWALEWTKVEWNYKVALLEGGSRRNPQAPRTEWQHGQGLNGIPAGVHMGPGWHAKLEFFDPVDFDVVASAFSKPVPSSSKSFPSDNDNEEVDGGWKSDSTLVYYDTKPLPPIPEEPPSPLNPDPAPPTVILPAVRVFSYCPTPNEFKYPQTSTPSSKRSTRASHLAREIWMPLMPPHVSLESPLKPYFPNQNPEEDVPEDDVWWQGTERCSGPQHPRRRQSSIDDVIAEWVADSDDFDGSLDQARPQEVYLENYAGEAENESGVGGGNEGIIRDDDSDTCKAYYYSDQSQSDSEGHEDAAWHGQGKQWAATDLPTPTEKRIEKEKEKKIATRLPTAIGNRSEDVNDKGEQILLPKVFEGFPEDIERRKHDWDALLWHFPGSEFRVKRYHA